MLAWLTQNIGTILICVALVAVFALLILSLVRDKKKGKASCCGGCAGCAMAGHCHPHIAQPTDTSSPEEDASASPTEEVRV